MQDNWASGTELLSTKRVTPVANIMHLDFDWDDINLL